MPGVKNSKLKLLYLAEIFERKTDETHYISATQLCDELGKLGIPAERKSIYKDIDVLREYGYDIIHTGSRSGGRAREGRAPLKLTNFANDSNTIRVAFNLPSAEYPAM